MVRDAPMDQTHDPLIAFLKTRAAALRDSEALCLIEAGFTTLEGVYARNELRAIDEFLAFHEASADEEATTRKRAEFRARFGKDATYAKVFACDSEAVEQS